MNISKLIALNINHNDLQVSDMDLNAFIESIQNSILDEAYYGEKAVKKIRDAMDDLREYIIAHPNESVHGTPVSKKLEEAVESTFGFKRVSIYWGNRAYGGGPYTYPNVVFFHAGSKPLEYGMHRDRFYDEKHELKLYVQMDQSLFTDINLTTDEAIAILLHEIGHNFDFSPFKIVMMWFTLIRMLMGDATSIIQFMVNSLISEYGRGVIQAIRNIDTIIGKTIPPIGIVLRGINKGTKFINKVFNVAISPLTIVAYAPSYAVMSPLLHLQNIALRKSEVYADSFAASYGYGSELATALDKLTSGRTEFSDINNPVIQIMSDIAKCQSEIIAFFYGGHGSTQKRLIKIRDKLEKDLANSDITPEMKKYIREDLDEIDTTYNALLNMDRSDRDTLTNVFRRLVDSWYAGKPYIAIQSIKNEYAE